MDVNHINPFLHSTSNVFSTMLNCTIQKTGLRVKDGSSPSYEVSAVIGLSGPTCGSVVFSLSRTVALKVAEQFLMEEFSEITSEVADAVGELTNMIAGGAKKELSRHQLYLGLPNVIVGRNHTITFPSNIAPICVDFETPWGPTALEVGLTSETADTPNATLVEEAVCT